MIHIKDKTGTIRFSTPFNSGSILKKELMKEEYILLKFSVEQPVGFQKGDYADTEYGVFEIIDLTFPVFNTATGGYDYDLRLDASYWKWKNKKLFYDRQGNKEASWSLTRTPDAHLSVVVSNLSALGYKYGNAPYAFFIDSSVDMSAKSITYNEVNIIDALSQIAEAWESEWWVEDNIIHLGKCEYNTAVDFEFGGNVCSMSRSESNDNFATRIYAFGSTRNLPSGYRKGEHAVFEGVVQKRLMLPSGVDYVDAYEGMAQEEAVEAIVVFDDVYPRRIGTMSGITTKEYTDTVEHEGGSKSEEKWKAYRFRDTGLVFQEKYLIPGQELRITFTSGALNGMDFAVSFDPDKKSGKEEQLFEIIRNENYGISLPGGSLIPANGDTYILYGFDTSFVSDAMLPAAEQELLGRAREYVEKSKRDPSVYDCDMNMVSVSGSGLDLNVGDRVNLIHPTYFRGGRQSRIYGFQKSLDGSQVSYVVGDSARYSRLAQVEGQVKEIVYQGNVYSGSGNGVYVIGRNDVTGATDRNVYSALRILDEISGRALSRVYDDTASGSILFKKGFTAEDLAVLCNGIVRNYLSSEQFIPGLLGEGFKIYQTVSGDWTLDIDQITVRKMMTVFELLISKIRAVNGGLVISPANGKVKSVFQSGNYYELGMEGDMTFVTGDLVRCQVVKSGNSRSYWVEVKQIKGNCILCFVSDFSGVVPEVGDDLVQFGNTKNVARQGIIYLTASEDGKPRVQILDKVNSTNLNGKNKVVLGCLDGITDAEFPADHQPSGYGLYANNVFLRGNFILKSGKTVEEVAQDKANEAVNNIQVGGRNLILNSKEIRIEPNSHNYNFANIYQFTETGTYTISADFDIFAGTGYQGTALIWDGVNEAGIISFTFSDQKRYSFTFNLEFVNEYTVLLLYAGLSGQTANVGATWKCVKLEKSNKSTDWSPAPEDVDTAINNIQIGGRNLVLNSKEERSNLESVSGGGGYIRYDTVLSPNNLKVGELYYLSFDARGLFNGELLTYGNNLNTYFNGHSTYITTEWKRYCIQKEITQVQTHNLFCEFWGRNANLGIYIRNVKLEKGNKATDWTPAPEDVEADINSRVTKSVYDTYIQATDAAIEARVKQEDFDKLGDRVGKTESIIEQLPDKITLAVNSVQIGGRNLILDSKFIRINGGKILYAELLPNKTYTFSIQDSKIFAPTSFDQTQGLVYTMSKDGKQIDLGFLKIEQGSSSVTFTYPENGNGELRLCGSIVWSGTIDYTKIKLEQGNRPTDWTSAPEDMEKAISNIQVGGRNLLRNSGNWRDANWNNGIGNNGGGYSIDPDVTFNGMSTVTTLVGCGLYHPWLQLENDVEYTYSAMVKCNETIKGYGYVPLHWHSGLNNQNEGKINILSYDTSVVANVWKRIYIVFKLTDGANSFRPFLYFGANGTTRFWVAYMKLEKGNKPTDWTLAPEDVDKEIASKTTLKEVASSLSITANKIKLASNTIELNGDTIAKAIEAQSLNIAGNLTIGTDGKLSIANEKVVLNPDGSGQLANGAITWDSNGNCFFKGTIVNVFNQIKMPISGNVIYLNYNTGFNIDLSRLTDPSTAVTVFLPDSPEYNGVECVLCFPHECTRVSHTHPTISVVNNGYFNKNLSKRIKPKNGARIKILATPIQGNNGVESVEWNILNPEDVITVE